MIEKISLKNFKCFEKIDVTCRELNLFTGINGMGKSTLIQALLLLRQTYEKNNCHCHHSTCGHVYTTGSICRQ